MPGRRDRSAGVLPDCDNRPAWNHRPILEWPVKGERDIKEEIELIAAVRKHVAQILKTLKPDQFERTGIHSEDGPISLEVLLQRITNHIPHHIAFIEEKQAAL